ncbi:DUF4232 domain-containing protein [Gandjariella thermophila]|uniref:Lipoprotein n=1 Tax=Gandjariella thermophila TaxID=1931992 RepID=A0A4D4J829_9PSEU|nr:DUF4232 domain-containing protein [Gandjariella thermophila]GDY30117.1 lipoprotein [Gandjariella thermophila]
MTGIGNRIVFGVLVAASGLLLGACSGTQGAEPWSSNGTPTPTTTTAAISQPAAAGATPSGATSVPATSPAGERPTTSGQAAPAPPATTRCSAAVLRGRVEPGSPGAGQRYARLVVTNTGRAPCTLYGYGGLQLVDGSGRPVPTDLRRDEQPGPTMVRLAPGASAAKNLHWTIVPSDGEPDTAPCEPAAATISVIPPDETQPFQAAWNLGEVCGHGRIGGSAYYAA